jgi:hypothetical protein
MQNAINHISMTTAHWYWNNNTQRDHQGPGNFLTMPLRICTVVRVCSVGPLCPSCPLCPIGPI